jgi:predicted SAM-dependent methyltransferase
MISHDSVLYKSLRWAYQPIKHSLLISKEWGSIPRRRQVIRKYLQGGGFKGLHIGCGRNLHRGWMNSDAAFTVNRILLPRLNSNVNDKLDIDFLLDITKPLPFPDGCLDAIHSSEVVEHIERRYVKPFFSEAHRVLKPGGVLRFTTPDLKAICQTYLGVHETATLADHATTWLEKEFSPDYWINAMFRFWGHQWVWDCPAMENLLRSSGFSRVECVQPQETKSGMPQLENLESRYNLTDSHCWTISMILEATK